MATIEQRIKWTIDKGTQQEAQKSLSLVENSFTSVEKSALSMGMGMDTASESVNKLRERFAAFPSAVASAEESLKSYDKELNATLETEKLIAEALKKEAAGLAEAEKATEKRIKAIKTWESAIAKALKAEQDALNKSAALAEKSSKNTTDALNKETSALKSQQKEWDDLRDSINPATTAKEKFFKQNAQDRLGSLAPATGILSGDNKRLREVGTTIRNLPSLPIPGQAFGTDTLARGVELAGRLGVSVGAFATVAAVAVPVAIGLGVAFGEYTKRALQAREVQQAYTESLKETIRALQEGTTTSGVEERRKELEQEVVIAERTAAALREVREARNEENDFIEDLFTMSRVFAGGTRKQLNEDINAADVAVRSASAAVEAFEFTLDETELAANDAAAAEKELADERSKSALSAANLAGTLATTLAQANDFGLSALESAQNQLTELQGGEVAGAGENAAEARLKQIEEQKASIEAQIKALRDSGVATEEVTEQLAMLESQLSALAAQSGIVEGSVDAAKARDDETRAILDQIDALKEAEKAAQEQARAQEQAAKEAEQAAQKIAQAQQRYADQLRDIGVNLNDSFKDLDIDTNRAFQDLAATIYADEQSALRDQQRELADIRKEGLREERDAVRGRDFSSLFDTRENRSDALADALQTFQAEGQDRLIEAQMQKDKILLNEDRKGQDLERQAARQRRDAAQSLADNLRQENDIKNSAYSASIGSTQAWAKAFVSTIQGALNASIGGGSPTSGNGGIDDLFREFARG